MIYRGITKKRSLKLKIAILFACLVMLIVEIIIKKYFYIPLLLLVVLAALLDKEHLISEEGVNIKYTILGFVSNYIWTWDEITTLHVDYKKARPNVMLHIGKDVVTRSFTMDQVTCLQVLDLARRMNPRIYINS